MANEDSVAVTQIPTSPPPPMVGRDYHTQVYQALIKLGAKMPDAMITASGDYLKHCQELSIHPSVTAALIYGAERHRHEVSRTTINEPTLGLQSSEASEGDPSAMAPAATEEDKLRFGWGDVSFDSLDDAKKFAKAVEKKSPYISAFVGGTQHGGVVTTNASPEIIEKSLKRLKLKGGYRVSTKAAAEAAEARGKGGVQSQIAAKTEKTECATCIPWQKVARDPKEHADFAELAKKFGSIKTPKDVYAVVGADLMRETQEVFLLLALNIHGELMAPPYEVARGQRDRVAVGIDNVMDAASDARCAAYVVTHSHPGGTPEPSAADMKLTRDIRAATPPGRVFVDHVVIAQNSAYSCVERKLYRVK